MAETPTTENGTAQAVDTVVNDAIRAGEQAATTAAEAALDSAVPFFALPVIHQISDAAISEVVTLIGDKISIGLQTVGTFIVIDTQVAGEKSGVSQALANLMLAEKSGDPQKIKEAIHAYATAQSALVGSDGSATPKT